ncbi:ABC transporter permease [Blastococcus sp. MG754426]|uniref:ABC transporter permease n=1 Tax=unclassified Blastococcus TaxID=2619396 RepID=UPI001EF138EE|nr:MULTISPECIES: ABC transporter permease [unclassified Blastococcus]MCF6506816.1 ABC transporter permease [Blastococcus sp. MG754426]MCF6511616.1 ABC transporter permease [Blastococcus sp. MG754427]
MSAVTAPAAPVPARRLRIGPAWRRPLALVGVTVALGWVVLAAFAPWIAPADPLAQEAARFLPPSAEHLMGTDGLGRDVLSRVVHGARISIPLAFMLVALSLVFGAVVGAVSGYVGGKLDEVLMRVVDLFFAFPAIILSMAVVAALGPNLRNAVLAIVVVSWPVYARVTRSLVLSLRNSEFVASSRLLGISSIRALVREILPNVAGPVLVLATLELGNAVLLLSGLSFLGLGAVPPTPEWGAMVSEGARTFGFWWVGVFPGLAILSIVLAFNFLGDSLRDALDPRTARATRGTSA